MKTAKEYLEPTRLYRLPEQFGDKMPTDKCDFNEAVKVIEQVIHDCKPKWISISDRLPDEKVDVLVINQSKGRKPAITFDYLVDGYFYRHWAVTHWMPLPSPPSNVLVNSED